MTTYMQSEYEALGLVERSIVTDVKVNSTITNHPDMLTDKELENVTAVFRSLETGLREATIYPRVRKTIHVISSQPLPSRTYTRP